MNKLAALPMLWGAVASATVTQDTGISLGLFIAGIVGTAGLVWWASTDRGKILKRICRLEERLAKIERPKAER